MPRLPWSWKNILKKKKEFFPSQGKVKEFCDWSGKFGKDLILCGNLKNIMQKVGEFCSVE